MKVYSLYHREQYVASFSTRKDCVDYGRVMGFDAWDCDIIQEYLNKTPYVPPFTSIPIPIPAKNPYNTDTMIDPTKPNHVNYWIGTKAELAQGHRRKDLDVV